jgi:hypothetical protein
MKSVGGPVLLPSWPSIHLEQTSFPFESSPCCLVFILEVPFGAAILVAPVGKY